MLMGANSSHLTTGASDAARTPPPRVIVASSVAWYAQRRQQTRECILVDVNGDPRNALDFERQTISGIYVQYGVHTRGFNSHPQKCDVHVGDVVLLEIFTEQYMPSDRRCVRHVLSVQPRTIKQSQNVHTVLVLELHALYGGIVGEMSTDQTECVCQMPPCVIVGCGVYVQTCTLTYDGHEYRVCGHEHGRCAVEFLLCSVCLIPLHIVKIRIYNCVQSMHVQRRSQ